MGAKRQPRRIYFIGCGGSSWRDPRNWSFEPDGGPVSRLHLRGRETFVVQGKGDLDLRGCPVQFEIVRFEGRVRLPGSRMWTDFSARPSRRRRALNWVASRRARVAPVVPRRWHPAVRVGLARVAVAGVALVVVPILGGGVASWFWVGGTGTWDGADTTHWASSTGGAGGAGVPAAGDSVTFDANSGAAATVTVAAAAANVASCTINKSDITVTYGGTISQSSCAVTLTAGTLNTNGQTVSWASFSSSNSNARTLTLGASAITLATGGWACSTTTNLTVTANTATVTASAAGQSFNGGSVNWNGLSVTWTTGISGTNASSIGGNGFTVANFTLTGGATKYEGITLGTSFTCTGTFTATGNNASANRLYVGPDVAATTRTITAAVVSISNVDFMDIAGAGAGTWSGTSIGDCGGNSGITVTPAVTRYAVATGNYSATTTWSTASAGASGASVPLPQDTMVMDGHGGVTIDIVRVGNVNVTSTANALVLGAENNSITEHYYFGDFKIPAGLTYTQQGNTLNCVARNGATIDTNGVVTPSIWVFWTPTGTYSLASDLTIGTSGGPRSWVLSCGTFAANGHNVKSGIFSANGNPDNLFGTSWRGIRNGLYSASVTGATGTWTIGGNNGAATVWDFSQSLQGGTADFSAATLVWGNWFQNSSVMTFQGGGLTYGSFTAAALNQPLTFAGNSTFGSLSITETATKTVTLPALGSGWVLVTGTATLNGASGQNVSLVSSSPGTAAKLWTTTYSNNGFVTLSGDVTVSTVTDRYWVGGTGNWSNSARWSDSSGGASGAPPPVSVNTANFDANSGTNATATVDVAASVAALTLNKSDLTLTHSATMAVAGAVTLTTGTLNTNGKACSWGSFSSVNANSRTLTLGASAITVSGAGVTVWQTTGASPITMTANTATVTFTGATASMNVSSSVNLNGMSVVFSGGGSMSMTNGVGLKNLTVTGTASKLDQFSHSNASIVTLSGQILYTGNSVAPNRLLVKAGSVGVAQTVTVNGSHGAHANVDFQDITIAGTAGALTGTSLGDCGGNTNITTTSPAAQSCTKTTSFSWSDPTAWTSRVPLPQDDVTVASAFSAGQTITVDLIRAGRSIDFSGCTGNPTVNYGGFGAIVANYGHLVFGNAVTCGSGNSPGPAGRNATFNLTADVNGRLGPGASMFMAAPGAIYKFTKATTFSSQIGVTAGTLDGNGQAITANTMNLAGSVSTVGVGVTFGSGTWMLAGTGTVLDFTSVNNATITPGTATITISDTSATAKTFAGNGYSYPTVRHVATGAASLAITGNNTFVWLDVEGASARTVTFPAGGRQKVTAATLTGSAGQALSLVSSTPGTATTIEFLSGWSFTSSNITRSSDIVLVFDNTATDAGLSQSDTLGLSPSRSLGDTGVTVSDSMIRMVARAILDSLPAASDVLVPRPARVVSDQAVTLAEALTMFASRRLADTGVSPVESIARFVARLVSDSLPALSDGIVRQPGRPVSDRALTLAEMLTRLAGRTVSDVGISESDSFTRSLTRTLTDALPGISDVLHLDPERPLADVGLVLTDLLHLKKERVFSDVGLSIIDVIVLLAEHGVADTGVLVSDRVAMHVARLLLDAGVSVDDLIRGGLRPFMVEPFDAVLRPLASSADIWRR